MGEMRDKLTNIIVIIIAIAICGFAIYFMEFHQAVYYTQVDNTKVEKISSTDEMKYEYTLDCYQEKGFKRKLKFKTSRELREDAYLKLEVTFIGVHAWEEVEQNELPNKVKIKL